MNEDIATIEVAEKRPDGSLACEWRGDPSWPLHVSTELNSEWQTSGIPGMPWKLRLDHFDAQRQVYVYYREEKEDE